MPPKNTVKSLYNLCLLYINCMILKIVRNIRENYGSYTSTLSCQIYVQNIQEHLLNYLHWPVIDTLLHSIDLPNDFDENEKLMVLGIYMNPDMKYMVPNFKLPPQDDFYMRQLCRLSKVVILDLTMVCTDEILKIVGDSCPLLQEIHIVSKMESVTSKCRKQLNALKLKFFVSDEGLEYIHKCKNLRLIIMNTILRSNSGGRKITHDGIRKLLIALPMLQYISYSDMGLVLEGGIENMEKLNLVKLNDNHIKPGHIDIFAKLCPNLKDISLKVPMTYYDQTMPGYCLTRLAESKLQPVSLELGFFPFDDQLKKYLTLKGASLTKFSISYGTDITSRSLYLLGSCCPNLKSLEVKILQPDATEDELVLNFKHSFFSNLETLYLIGVNWNPSVIFPLCVHNAKHLHTVGLINREYNKPVDDVFKRLLYENPLTFLRKICLHEGFPMKQETLDNFVINCPNLTSLVLGEQSNLLPHIKEIKIRNNYNIQIRSFDAITCSRNCHCYTRTTTL